jgi:hypothetical protein
MEHRKPFGQKRTRRTAYGRKIQRIRPSGSRRFTTHFRSIPCESTLIGALWEFFVTEKWSGSGSARTRNMKSYSGKCDVMRSNSAFERTNGHRGRAVLAMNCWLGGAEWAPCMAAQLNR